MKMEFLTGRISRCESNAERERCFTRPLDGGRNSNSTFRMTNDSILTISDSDQERMAIDVLYMYVGIVAALVAMAEILTLLILKRAKVFFQIRYFSGCFILADTLFQCSSFVNACLIMYWNDSDSRLIKKLFRQLGQGILSCITFSSVAIMSWDRVISLAWPLQYRVFVSPTRVKCVIVANWILNTLVYSISVGMFYHACSNKSNNWCQRVSKNERFLNNTEVDQNRNLLASNELVASTILLTTYEIFNITACCILTYQVRCHMKRQLKMREYLKRQICLKGDSQVNTDCSAKPNAKTRYKSSIFSSICVFRNARKDKEINRPFGTVFSTSSGSELFVSESSRKTSLSFTSTSIDNNGKRNESLRPCRENVSTCIGNENAKLSGISTSSITSNSTEIFTVSAQNRKRSLHLLMDNPYIANNGRPLDIKHGSPRTTVIAITKVILVIAILQFFFHVPLIVRHIELIFGKRGGDEIKNMVARVFLQIGSIPSVYLYVLKLKQCQQLVKSMCCCMRKTH